MSVEQHLQKNRVKGDAVCAALRRQTSLMGLPDNCIDPDIDRAEYSLSRDRVSGENALIGIWRDQNGYKQGEILFHADGSFYAEYDVIRQHPKKARWFVESVIAWGRDNDVRAEPKLLPAVE